MIERVKTYVTERLWLYIEKEVKRQMIEKLKTTIWPLGQGTFWGGGERGVGKQGRRDRVQWLVWRQWPVSSNCKYFYYMQPDFFLFFFKSFIHRLDYRYGGYSDMASTALIDIHHNQATVLPYHKPKDKHVKGDRQALWGPVFYTNIDS